MAIHVHRLNAETFTVTIGGAERAFRERSDFPLRNEIINRLFVSHIMENNNFINLSEIELTANNNEISLASIKYYLTDDQNHALEDPLTLEGINIACGVNGWSINTTILSAVIPENNEVLPPAPNAQPPLPPGFERDSI